MKDLIITNLHEICSILSANGLDIGIILISSLVLVYSVKFLFLVKPQYNKFYFSLALTILSIFIRMIFLYFYAYESFLIVFGIYLFFVVIILAVIVFVKFRGTQKNQLINGSELPLSTRTVGVFVAGYLAVATTFKDEYLNQLPTRTDFLAKLSELLWPFGFILMILCSIIDSLAVTYYGTPIHPLFVFNSLAGLLLGFLTLDFAFFYKKLPAGFATVEDRWGPAFEKHFLDLCHIGDEIPEGRGGFGNPKHIDQHLKRLTTNVPLRNFFYKTIVVSGLAIVVGSAFKTVYEAWKTPDLLKADEELKIAAKEAKIADKEAKIAQKRFWDTKTVKEKSSEVVNRFKD